MKKLLTLLVVMAVATTATFANTPAMTSYQAKVTMATGSTLVNTADLWISVALLPPATTLATSATLINTGAYLDESAGTMTVAISNTGANGADTNVATAGNTSPIVAIANVAGRTDLNRAPGVVNVILPHAAGNTFLGSG